MTAGPSDPPSRPSRDRWLALLVPAILVLVATNQLVLASTTDLTPWRGGGFGMFSTTDNHDQRFLRITAVTDTGGEIPVDARALLDTDPPLRDAFVRARARPTTGNLDALAAALAEAELVLQDGIAAPREPEDGAGENAGAGDAAVTVDSIEVVDLAVFRVWFERGTDTLEPELLVEHQAVP